MSDRSPPGHRRVALSRVDRFEAAIDARPHRVERKELQPSARQPR